MTQNNTTLPRIDLDAPGMPIPSLDEFLRQAAVIHGALVAAKPLLYVETASVKAAAGEGLSDLIELAVAGKHWATAVWSLFSTVEDHLQAAGPAPAR